MYDFHLNDFPRLAGETDDAPRIQRAIDAASDAVLFIPAGKYEIASRLTVSNRCSIEMAHHAELKAVAEMDYVLVYLPAGWDCFLTGGTIDGNGLASCLSLNRYIHFTLRDVILKNGKRYGLGVGTIVARNSCELIVNNLYCRCTLPGLAGNVGIGSFDGDSHYTDCIVVDYTTGISLDANGFADVGSNRLTRCHVWGGPIPPKEPGGIPEMLVGSVSFRIAAGDTILRDCYSDTGYIGYQIFETARLIGCSYYNNERFPLDDITVIDHRGGSLLVADGHFTQHTEHAALYRGDNRDVIWRDNHIEGKDLRIPE